MTRRSAWHSIKSSVYHVCSNCTEGNNIERENLRSGTGNGDLCDTCKDLVSKGGC